MRFYQKLDGAVHCSAREYDIASDTAIVEGQVVKLSEGRVAAASAGETGAILGIAVENHSGQSDALDPRSDGTSILVIDDPDLVMQCAAPEIRVKSGTATTLAADDGQLAAFASADLKGGWVRLVAKTENSANTDTVGHMRRIEGFSNGTLTVESGGIPSAGDVYAVFPPVGFGKGNLSADGTALILSATANLPLRVVGCDRRLSRVNLMASKHVFGVNA